ncbi:EAL domain-containing protein [Cohnella xylanilytica]|uniref:EAL domain-containing protein n=1 Tax=Cohnella xylanilytica TaxID=557555 RepID=A0A841TW19_9BACL|nr:EAL domain-containing protein [Cohnella xylanilytica]MBB6691208.1 EAL domain-containing protein [Cohnella xylanilytica]
MMTSWLNINGWERLKERVTELASGREAEAASIGLVCIDRRDAESGASSVAADPEGANSNDGRWNDWLAKAFPGERLWFVDELGSHLWIGVEIPVRGGAGTAAEAHLTRVAGRLRRLLSAEAGTAPIEASGVAVRGTGAAVLPLKAGIDLKDSLYEGMLAAVGRMRSLSGDRDSADLELRAEMERLLKERSIRSVYQPITRIGTGEVFGYEALTRCPPGSRFDGPLALFNFAEREGYAFALDRLAREKAIGSSPSLNGVQKIFINVTLGIMNDPGFVSGQTAQWLRQRGLQPGQVVLELTERSSIDDFEEAKKILRHYRSQGYEIAIDDAGAGYSSLQSIVELSPDYIKVDKSLVQNADRDEMKKQMLRTFVRFAKRMNIRTVAEGIERPEELRLARRVGIDFGQGYLLGRPGEYADDPVRDGLPNG